MNDETGGSTVTQVYRLRCYECERRVPEDDTTLVSAKIGGDYRRAPRRGEVRVCRSCTEAHVEFVRKEQERNLASPVNTGRIQWEQAARRFDVDVSGLLLDRMTGRVAP